MSPEGRRPTDGFRAPWWLRSPHLQTVYGPLLRRGPGPALRRERIELDDGVAKFTDDGKRRKTAPAWNPPA